jgi:hypothetical protein
MEKLDKVALINDLDAWGGKELGRPRFGEECLWASAAQGVVYDFDKGYNEALTKDCYEGYKNKEYLDFMDNHDNKEPYLYVQDEYGGISAVWSIPELTQLAKSKHEKQVDYLNKLKDDVDKCENFRQVINYLKRLDSYKMPSEFPAENFVIADETFEEFLKDSIKRACKKFGESVDVSKHRDSPYPYQEYLGLW